MNKRLGFQTICLAAVLGMTAGCGGGGGGGQSGTAPSANSFKFLVITDTHVRLPGNPDDAVYDNQGNLGNFGEVLGRIRTDHPDADFVITCGDNAGCLFSHDPDDYGIGQANPAEQFKAMMDSLGMSYPYRVVLGNHDYEDGFDAAAGSGITSSDPAGMEAVWKKVLGIDPYYAFIHKGVRFIVLNSNRGASRTVPCGSSEETGCEGSFDEAQMAWLEAQLDQDSKPCLLFLHHPPITDHNQYRFWAAGGTSMQVAAGDRFYGIASSHRERIRGIFAGHGHLWEEDTLDGLIPVRETASIGDLGGSSSSLRAVWMDPETGTMLTE
ncbi:MAG TPA: metallophosphoesterase [Holophaga sp.]|nr:metallophosphoesterase [Holophaga sp.]HPS67836.1 metallophosphoesterase [Holophaga sp.]